MAGQNHTLGKKMNCRLQSLAKTLRAEIWRQKYWIASWAAEEKAALSFAGPQWIQFKEGFAAWWEI
jgi:hypothetical protein